VSGWSADGRRVLFTSAREVANSRSGQFYEIDAAGGFEHRVMEAVAMEGSWSPDGARLAYRPYRKGYEGSAGWRRYRGGDTPPIWILEMATQKLEVVPHVNASDSDPAWSGEEVVFISDRSEGAANVFAYDTRTRQLRQLTHETQWDVRSLAVAGRTAVYECAGRLHELDLDRGTSRPLAITVAAESRQARVQWRDAARTITSVQLSPTGKRVLVSARGDVFTVPVKDGSTRNLTQSPGVRDKDALWSADGQRIAYVTDLGMQHALVVRGQDGLDEPRVHPLGKTGYFTLLAWSPDGTTLVYQDNHLHLYAFDLGRGAATRIDTSLRRRDVDSPPGGGRANFEVAFSPDSRWLAYTVTGANHFSQIRVHDFRSGTHAALTDGLSDADSPVFGGADYLYFSASINSGPSQVGLDLSSQERAIRRGLYAAVLAADGKSPLAPRTGDEEPRKGEAEHAAAKAAAQADARGEGKDKGEGKAAAKPKAPPAVRIDFEGLADRIVGLPVAERRYESLAVGADGALYYLERAQPGVSAEPPEAEHADDGELYRFDFAERKAKPLKAGIAHFSLSADGKKLLVAYAKGRLEVADAGDKPELKPVDLSGLRIRVDMQQEWRQIFDEAWWMEKEFFYDPHLHGVDWDAVYARYRPFVEHVKRREDLNELLVEMIAELQVGHNRAAGGDLPEEPGTRTGLLGADLVVENGHYRIRAILRGDRWNPFLKAPLAAPGVNVHEGDYLLAVNGRPLDAKVNLYAALENTVGRQVSLRVAADPTGSGARDVVVEPVASEVALRQWRWIEHNRDYVARKSGGRVAYVYLPNTAGDGFQYFNRMFFAQVDKAALIVDERKNGGGQAANYITEILGRPYLSGWKDRDGLVFSTPGGAIYGPKVMLIDQDAGSGGDFLPDAFKRLKLGTLVGTRTWGGLIGISANPSLIDGGSLVVPYFRFFTPDGRWSVENEGVTPDREVVLDPAAVNRGEDPQLDAAIATALEQLRNYVPVERTEAPPYPTEPGR
ncbi:MAG: PDZ domain-containing protein, partial [Proteobacteria bacterium]|nr:PDZ domain-containing protein [Pseudomonadota bacterium]